jgi:hypothetical protein
MIIKDIKLCPLKNPNCEIINSVEDLLEKFNANPILVVDEYGDEIGHTLQNGYIQDDWIWGSIELDKQLKWKNVKCSGEFVNDEKWDWELEKYDNITMTYER